MLLKNIQNRQQPKDAKFQFIKKKASKSTATGNQKKILSLQEQKNQWYQIQAQLNEPHKGQVNQATNPHQTLFQAANNRFSKGLIPPKAQERSDARIEPMNEGGSAGMPMKRFYPNGKLEQRPIDSETYSDMDVETIQSTNREGAQPPVASSVQMMNLSRKPVFQGGPSLQQQIQPQQRRYGVSRLLEPARETNKENFSSLNYSNPGQTLDIPNQYTIEQEMNRHDRSNVMDQMEQSQLFPNFGPGSHFQNSIQQQISRPPLNQTHKITASQGIGIDESHHHSEVPTEAFGLEDLSGVAPESKPYSIQDQSLWYSRPQDLRNARMEISTPIPNLFNYSRQQRNSHSVIQYIEPKQGDEEMQGIDSIGEKKWSSRHNHTSIANSSQRYREPLSASQVEAPSHISQSDVDNLVSRLYKFEQERQKKLKQAKIQKKKEEMTDVTFMPKLVARQSMSGALSMKSSTANMMSTVSLSRVQSGTLKNKPSIQTSLNRLNVHEVFNQNNTPQVLSSNQRQGPNLILSEKPLDKEAKYQDTQSNTVEDFLTRERNSRINSNEELLAPVEVNPSLEMRNGLFHSRSKSTLVMPSQQMIKPQDNHEVFQRLFEDGSKLKIMKEEMIERHNKELVNGLFVPRINFSQKTLSQSTRGRKRSLFGKQAIESVEENSKSFQVAHKRNTSVFDLLMQDAARREKQKEKVGLRAHSQEIQAAQKQTIKSQKTITLLIKQGKIIGTQKNGKKRLSNTPTRHIIQERMVEEFDQALRTYAMQIGVRYSAPGEDQTAPEFYKEELTVQDFRCFVQEVKILNPGHASDDKIFQRLLKILTPSESKRPVLTVRNLRVLFYGILNVFEEWMNAQDPYELDATKESTYKLKIQKYKMMVSKLNSNGSEALYQSSKPQMDLLENIPKDQLHNLTELEREQFVLRRNQLHRQVPNAVFRGKSLCFSVKSVQRISKMFDTLNKSFFYFVQKQNWRNSVRRKKKGSASDVTAEVYTSAFKPKTKELMDKSEHIRNQFIEMSKKKEQMAKLERSSQKKGCRSLEKPVKLIIQTSSKKLFQASKLNLDNVEGPQSGVNAHQQSQQTATFVCEYENPFQQQQKSPKLGSIKEASFALPDGQNLSNMSMLVQAVKIDQKTLMTQEFMSPTKSSPKESAGLSALDQTSLGLRIV